MTEPDKSGKGSWRRFLAILCLMEFYTAFVRGGTMLWESWTGRDSDLSIIEIPFWVNVLLTLRAASLFACGRALWFESKHTRHWIVLVLVLTLSSILCGTWAANQGLVRWGAMTSWAMNWSWRAVNIYVLSDSAKMLPVLACLIAAFIAERRRRASRSFAMASWVFVAATWCFASAIAEQMQAGVASRMGAYASFFTMPALVSLAYSALFVLTGLLLIRRSFLARSTALILAAIGATVAAEWTYELPWLFNTAIHALYLSVPGYPGGLPYHWVHTREEFVGACVESVRLVGPWLLIALYARFVPMRTPPDDGSPYPRRYCRKCLYNLHGLESDRCPECGSELALSATLCTLDGSTVSARLKA
jgi:hypothetical protein